MQNNLNNNNSIYDLTSKLDELNRLTKELVSTDRKIAALDNIIPYSRMALVFSVLGLMCTVWGAISREVVIIHMGLIFVALCFGIMIRNVIYWHWKK